MNMAPKAVVANPDGLLTSINHDILKQTEDVPSSCTSGAIAFTALHPKTGPPSQRQSGDRKGYPVANDLFPLGPDTTPWRKLTDKYVSVETFRGQEILTVDTEGLRLLPKPLSVTSTTFCGPATSSSSQRSLTIRKRPRTTVSSPSTF
jgi:hypothetical protein